MAAIENLAKMAGAQNSSGYAKGFASAVNQLAEARAWLRSPSQAHGGGSSDSEG